MGNCDAHHHDNNCQIVLYNIAKIICLWIKFCLYEVCLASVINVCWDRFSCCLLQDVFMFNLQLTDFSVRVAMNVAT